MKSTCVQIGLILLTIALSLVRHVRAQAAPDFRPLFELENSFSVDSTLTVGGIAELDVSGDRLLVTDRVGQGVYILAADGGLVRKLNVESCYPGHTFTPITARINRTGILVQTAGIPLLRYTLSGECLGVLRRQLIPPAKWDLAEDGYLYVLDSYNSVLQIYDSVGDPIRDIDIRAPAYPELERRWQGGGIRAVGSQVYTVGVIADSLYIVSNREGVHRIRIESDQIRMPASGDLPSQSGATLFDRLRTIPSEATITNELFLLTSEILLVTYIKNNKRGFVLVRNDGSEIGHIMQTEPYAIVFADNGRMYVEVQPPMKENGVIPNPMLLTYRFVRND